MNQTKQVQVINPKIVVFKSEEVIYELGKASFSYPRNRRECDFAYSPKYVNEPFFPACYNYVCNHGCVPSINKLARYMYDNHSFCAKNEPTNTQRKCVVERTKKLVMDFFRDLHTLTLLSDRFGSVFYEKGNDINLNVDYTTVLKSYLMHWLASGNEYDIGIAAAMMSHFEWQKQENYIQVKKERRRQRAEEKAIDGQFNGEIFQLNNETRGHKTKVKGCWLFGKEHIDDLLSDIKEKFGQKNDISESPIGIVQLSLFE